MDKISYVVIDTNVFIELSHISVDYVPKKRDAGFRHILRSIKRLNRSGHVKFVITPTVLAEIMRVNKDIKPSARQRELDFLKEHCLVYKPEDEADFAAKTYNLASDYLESGVMQVRKKNNYGDSLIMAEASLLGLNLLTMNSRDFSFYDDECGGKRKKNHRANDIMELNKRKKLSYTTMAGMRVTPRPYSPEEFMELFKSGMFEGKKNAKQVFGE